MGVVYKAEDTKLDRLVALKFLPHHLTANEAEQARFLQEAKSASALNHPNVCTIHGIGEHGGQQFIEMEYVDGVTLRQKFSGSPLKVDDALSYAIQIGEALQEAHSRGIVHRDIKSDNIMVNAKNQIKVMDFGLAKLKGSLKLTRTSSTVGTLAYMAPEQIQGGEVDARSDIFSFGIVLYEMVTARTPFRGEHEASMMYSILNEEPEPATRHRPELSSEFLHIFNRALEKNPEDRYQSVNDLLIDLRRLKRESARVSRPSYPGMEVGKPQAVETQPPSSGQGSLPKRHWIIPSFTGVAGVVVLAVGYFLFLKHEPAIDSLAVLPFANVGADPGVEYLSDGITENIINKLSQLSQLRVIPRSLVTRYKNRDIDPREAGRDLNVAAVLTGKVVQRGDQLSIQAELIDVKNVSQLWGEQYNKKLADIITVQEDIVKRVSEKLRTEISREEEHQLTAGHTTNPEAFQLYLKGRYYWNKRTDESSDRALVYFQQAVDIDPQFALAYVGLGDCYVTGAGANLRPDERGPKIKAAAMKALEIDDRIAEAHATLGTVRGYYEYDFAGAEGEFRRAIELNPNYPTAHHWLGEFLVFMGRFDEGLSEYKGALALDPLSLAISSDYGLAYYFARQYDQAIVELKKTIAMDPNFVRAHFYLADVYAMKKNYDDVFEEILRGSVAAGESTSTMERIKNAYGRSGRAGLLKLGLEQLKAESKSSYRPAERFAYFYVNLGEHDEAIRWLEKAYEERSWGTVTLKVDPLWDPLRSHPRFIALLNKIGFER